jgi:iron complex transport system substrate-binding protein
MTRSPRTFPRHLTGTLAVTATAALTLGLSACGSDDGGGSGGTDGGDRTVSLQSAFGQADYPVAPERAVVTASALDNVLALGITPTAVVMTAQDEDAPWRDGKLDNVDRITVTTYGDIDTEKIAAEDPDVIIGDIYWIDSKDEYDRLSAIAPTLNGPSQDPTRATWKERLTQLGDLYDRQDAARQIISEDAARFDKAKKDMPGLAGKTGWIGRDQGDGSIGTSPDPTEASNTFLYDLGMKLPATIEGRPPNGASGAFVASPENYDQFAADFSVLYTAQGAEKLTGNPAFAALPQVKRGTMLTDRYAVVIGLAQPSSLVRAWALDELRPTLDKVATSAD